MIRFAVALVATGFLAGCAPATVGALRTQAAGQETFEVDANYQAVYRAVVERARACHQTTSLGGQVLVTGDLYTDIRSGTVSVAVHFGLGIDTHLAIDIKALDEKRTRVDTFYAVAPWQKRAKAVEGWARTGSADC